MPARQLSQGMSTRRVTHSEQFGFNGEHPIKTIPHIRTHQQHTITRTIKLLPQKRFGVVSSSWPLSLPAPVRRWEERALRVVHGCKSAGAGDTAQHKATQSKTTQSNAMLNNRRGGGRGGWGEKCTAAVQAVLVIRHTLQLPQELSTSRPKSLMKFEKYNWFSSP